jgi:hypothetical protein
MTRKRRIRRPYKLRETWTEGFWCTVRTETIRTYASLAAATRAAWEYQHMFPSKILEIRGPHGLTPITFSPERRKREKEEFERAVQQEMARDAKEEE